MRKGIVFLLIVVLSTGSYGYWLYRQKQNESPRIQIDEARKKISEAESVLAPKFASKTYRKATVAYDSAMVNWQRENERLFFLRNYDRSAGFAKEALEQAGLAVQLAVKNKAGEKDILSKQLSELHQQIETFKTTFKGFPRTQTQTKEITQMVLMAEEARQAHKSANYETCSRLIVKAKTQLVQLNVVFDQAAQEYFKDYKYWDKWVSKSISESRRTGGYCIVVDKIARECTLYKGGMVQRVFPVELGPNWVGDKNRQGDKATPEGMYKVVSKKEKSQTKYHKALLLDYPNEEDKKRFQENKRNGSIPMHAKIGNLIEIHGHGGKGADWTEGCVALENSDMDKLYAICPAGTRVTIVGSTKPYNEFLNR